MQIRRAYIAACDQGGHGSYWHSTDEDGFDRSGVVISDYTLKVGVRSEWKETIFIRLGRRLDISSSKICYIDQHLSRA